jgi:hypothetical protein
MAARDPVARARELAGALDDVADVVEKYRLLEALRRGEPGRTTARRDAMRAIADRFPGALREWDEAPLDELVRRRREAEETLVALLSDGESGLRRLAAAERDWLRYGMEVHRRLRSALRVKRWIAGRELTDALAADAARALAVDRASIEAVVAPPARRVSEAIYRQVAAEHGVSVDELKAALFPHTPNPEGA